MLKNLGWRWGGGGRRDSAWTNIEPVFKQCDTFSLYQFLKEVVHEEISRQSVYKLKPYIVRVSYTGLCIGCRTRQPPYVPGVGL